jgi:tryptophan 2,3-dioxygenase
METVLGLKHEQRIPYGNVDAIEHIRSFGDPTPAALVARARIEAASQEITLRDALIRWLARTPIQGSSPTDPGDDAVVTAFIEAYLARAEAHQRAGIEALAGTLGEAERARITERVEMGLAASRAFLSPEDPVERRARAGLLFIESYRELPLLAWPRLLLDTVVELEEQLLLFRNRHARMVERTIGRRVGTGGSAGVEYLDKTTQQRIFPELWAVRSALLPRVALPPLETPEKYGFAG